MSGERHGGLILEVDGLDVAFPAVDGKEDVKFIDDVTFAVGEGERLGLVGESGAGKSLIAHTILGLLREPGRVTAGSIRYKGRDILGLRPKELRDIRGSEIALIPRTPHSHSRRFCELALR